MHTTYDTQAKAHVGNEKHDRVDDLNYGLNKGVDEDRDHEHDHGEAGKSASRHVFVKQERKRSK